MSQAPHWKKGEIWDVLLLNSGLEARHKQDTKANQQDLSRAIPTNTSSRHLGSGRGEPASAWTELGAAQGLSRRCWGDGDKGQQAAGSLRGGKELSEEDAAGAGRAAGVGPYRGIFAGAVTDDSLAPRVPVCPLGNIINLSLYHQPLVRPQVVLLDLLPSVEADLRRRLPRIPPLLTPFPHEATRSFVFLTKEGKKGEETCPCSSQGCAGGEELSWRD